MCYIIAKKFDDVGCLALRTEQGEKLGALTEYLSLATLEKNVQIVVLGDTKSFGEYEPYRFLDNEGDFIYQVLKM
ncbi:hypothetical protein BGT96_15735 [Clostridioides difficile]|uniref:DUF6718 family protein n=1 Tax=Clostridioides difficile TaxID=1496 RepID=UPI000BB1D29F|nr:DUF6718 family protein [Clostridioides difficile]EGT3953411.1 hypothetical protein [Clostridioides difficile]EJX3465426.1 hypothetical protein [Clostridioides difficile]MBY1700014.1 hypothetical protein [Clostridioides difficile]MBY2483382.1 hypothetical protein [Clostridioides difficile]MBY2557780.1 hypothetical protein [Clostridioides difficile]